MNLTFKHNIKSGLIIYLLAFPQIFQAQKLNPVFIMSSVGEIENLSNNSMPVTLGNSTACLSVQNGAALLNLQKDQDKFSIHCEVPKKFNTLGIKLYPNPVITNTNLKLLNVPPLNESFKISIWGVDGSKITSGKATGQDLYQGLPLDFSILQDGTYFIQIESGKYSDALKFIKTNN
jgi:hypothetical protein